MGTKSSQFDQPLRREQTQKLHFADDVLTASDFWGGAGSAACQGFITQLGRNFQVIYEQANAHGQKVQAAGNNMAQTDSAVGSSWA